jgi:hypothetical protein
MGALIFKSFKSATLVEAIVSLVIIVTFTGLTVMIFVQTFSTGYSVRQIRTQGLIEKYVEETNENQNFFTEEFREDGFVVKKLLVDHNFSPQLAWIRISVFTDNEKFLKTQNFLLLKR